MGMKRVTRGGIYKQESAGAGRKGTKVVGPVGRDRSQVNTLSALSLSLSAGCAYAMHLLGRLNEPAKQQRRWLYCARGCSSFTFLLDPSDKAHGRLAMGTF
jgi:hypothetical protein